MVCTFIQSDAEALEVSNKNREVNIRNARTIKKDILRSDYISVLGEHNERNIKSEKAQGFFKEGAVDKILNALRKSQNTGKSRQHIKISKEKRFINPPLFFAYFIERCYNLLQLIIKKRGKNAR